MLVRNITGTTASGKVDTTSGENTSGCFLLSTAGYGYEGSSGKNIKELSFNASRSVPTANEVRPINISAIPLIYVV